MARKSPRLTSRIYIAEIREPHKILDVLDVRIDWVQCLPEANPELIRLAQTEAHLVLGLREKVMEEMAQIERVRQQAAKLTATYSPEQIRKAIEAAVDSNPQVYQD